MGVLSLRRQILMAQPHKETVVGDGIATFDTDFKAAMKTVIPFSPVQDLHGMSYPYPAGVSINLIPDTTDTNNGYVAGYYLKSDGSTVANANYYISEYIELDSATAYTWSNRVNTIINPSICFYDENKDFISGIAINKQYSHTFTPPEGAVYCRSSQTTYTYQEVASTNPAFQLEVGSTATAYRRYSNICLISGRTGCEINHPGKNFFNDQNPISNLYITSEPFKVGIHSSYKLFVAPIKKNTTYTFSRRMSTGYPVFGLSDEYPKNGISVFNVVNMRNTDYVTFNSGKHTFCLYAKYKTDTGAMSLALGNSAIPANTPYSGITLPITFTDPTTGDPLTVYGGTVTLNEDGSADVISTHCVYDIPSTQWTYSPNASVWYITRASLNPKWDISGGSQDGVIRDIVCSAYKTETYNHTTYPSYAPCIAERRYNANWIAVQTGSANVRPVDCQVKMKLATPVTYHFPNVGQLKSFLGQNNIWSDLNGDPTVTFWKHG